MKLFRKKSDLYLSDRPPLSPVGVVALVFTYAVIIMWAIAILWPLAQMWLSAFNGEQGRRIISGGAYKFSFKHFEILFNDTLYFNWVLNTIFIASATAIVTVILTSFTGFAYSRFRFKGRKPTLMGILLIQMIPGFAGIVAYYTMHSIITTFAPWFTRQMMLILIYSGGGIAMNTFILKGYLDSISTELDDAARIDGCSNMKVYRLILMPVARPMLSIIALWSFIGPFLDFLLPRILLRSPEDYTIAAGLWTLVTHREHYNEPAFAAGGLLTAVPIVIVFVALQKHLVSGLASGATKG